MGLALLSMLALVSGVVLYGAASVLFFVEVAKSSASLRSSLADGARRRPSLRAPLLLGFAAALHFGYISAASFVAHVCPVDSVHFILSMTAVIAAALYIVARFIGRAKPRENLDALGLVIAPLGLAFLLGTYFLEKPLGGPSASLGSGFIALHVVVNLVGIALFVLAGAAAALYLVQERRLKRSAPAP